MNAKTNLTEAQKLEHAISILEIVAMFAENADIQCDETQFNLTTNPEHLKLASRAIFAARALIGQIGFIADSALVTLGGQPCKDGELQKWISNALQGKDSQREQADRGAA